MILQNGAARRLREAGRSAAACYELDYPAQALQPAQRAGAARRGLSRQLLEAARKPRARRRRRAGVDPRPDRGQVGGARGAARLRPPSAARLRRSLLRRGHDARRVARCSYGERGDFAAAPYDIVEQSAGAAGARVQLRRRGQRRRARAHASTRRITLDGVAAELRPIASARRGRARRSTFFAPELDADAAGRRRARPLLPRRRPRAVPDERKLASTRRVPDGHGARAGQRVGQVPRARQRHAGGDAVALSARDRVAVGGRLRAHLPGLGDHARLARRLRRRRAAVRGKVTIETSSARKLLRCPSCARIRSSAAG